jgi:hypothetical protein
MRWACLVWTARPTFALRDRLTSKRRGQAPIVLRQSGLRCFERDKSDTEGTPTNGHCFVLLAREQGLDALTFNFGTVRRKGPRRIRQAGVAESDAITQERIDMRLRHGGLTRPTSQRMRVVSIRIPRAEVVGRMRQSRIIDGRSRIHRRHAEEVRRKGAVRQTHIRRGQTNALRARQHLNRVAEAFVEEIQAVDFVH